MHVELPLLIVNHYVQTVNLCCIIIMASRGSGRSKDYYLSFSCTSHNWAKIAGNAGIAGTLTGLNYDPRDREVNKRGQQNPGVHGRTDDT